MADQAETILKNTQETPDTIEVTKPEDNTELTTIKTQLSSILNQEGNQKYSTVEDALKSIPFATTHISKLEQENAELTTKLNQAQTVKDILDEISVQRTPSEEPTVQGLDESRVAEIVSQQLTVTEQQRLIQVNQAAAAAALQAHFGDVQTAEKKYIAKAEELGISVQFLNDVAAKSPKALLNLFDITAVEKQEIPEKIQDSGITPVEIQDETKPKSVMWGASHSDLKEAWRAARPKQD